MKVLDSIASYAHWFLRLAIGSVFIYHGIGKFFDLNGFAQSMNLSFTVALFVALAEVGGGLFVLLGGFLWDWLTRLGALILMPVMIGAIAMVHWGQWSAMPSETHPVGGMEFQVTLLLIMLYLFFKGNNVKIGKATLAPG